MIITGMVNSIDNRPGIKKMKLTTNNSNSVGTEKCTFFDTKLGIDKFNTICIMLMNAGRPVPNAPAAANGGEKTPQKVTGASAAKRKLDADANDADAAKGKGRAHYRPLTSDK